MSTINSHRVACWLVAAVILMLAGCSSHQTAAPKKSYAFWPPAPDEPHVQFLVSYSSTADITPGKSKFDEMLYGKNSEIGLIKPYGVAMWNGRIYATDIRSKGVMVWDLRKRESRIMGASGTGEVQKPVDVSIGPDGSKYVVDSARNAVITFDAEERFVGVLTLPNFNPVSVAAFGNELFVSDFDGQCIKVLEPSTGRLLRTIGSGGPEDGKFVRPLSVRTDRQGNIYVVDILRCRVQKFSRDGKLLLAFGDIGNTFGSFVRPKHMGVDSNGFVYIVDAAFNNVQVFDAEGKFVGFFGSRGDHPGAMDLPAGLCIDEGDLDLFQQYVHPAFEIERLIVVSNQFGPNKIAVYAQGHLKQGKTVADVSGGRSKVNLGLDTGKGPTTGPITMGSPLPEQLTVPTTAPAAQPGR